MHLENSRTKPRLTLVDHPTGYILKPQTEEYPCLPVNTVNPADTEQLALTLNGKKNNLRKNDFLKLATTCNIDKSVTLRLIDSLKKQKNAYLNEIDESYMTPDLKENLKCIVTDRIELL